MSYSANLIVSPDKNEGSEDWKAKFEFRTNDRITHTLTICEPELTNLEQWTKFVKCLEAAMTDLEVTWSLEFGNGESYTNLTIRKSLLYIKSQISPDNDRTKVVNIHPVALVLPLFQELLVEYRLRQD